MLSHSRPPISRRRVAGLSVASPRAAVSTHPGPHRTPRAARTLSLTHLLACHTSFARRFPCRLRSSDPSAWLLGHEQIPFPKGLALYPEVRFAWSWVGYPSRRQKGCGVQSPLGPKVYPKEEEEEEFIQNRTCAGARFLTRGDQHDVAQRREEEEEEEEEFIQNRRGSAIPNEMRRRRS